MCFMGYLTRLVPHRMIAVYVTNTRVKYHNSCLGIRNGKCDFHMVQPMAQQLSGVPYTVYSSNQCACTI